MYRKSVVVALIALSGPLLALPVEEMISSNPSIEARQGPGAGLAIECKYEPVEDGKVTEAIFHRQVTATNNCGNGGCSAGRVEEQSFSWEVSGGISTNFVGVEGTVGETETEGKEYPCDASGEAVCVWAAVKYKVYEIEVDGNNCKNDVRKATAKAPKKNPNTGGDNVSYYCVRGKACRVDGAGYWAD